MDTANTRFPKNHRIKSGIIRTPIHPNESISSWLIRAALNCGTEPITFTGFYWRKLRLWTYDLDRGFEPFAANIYEDITELSLDSQINLADHSLYSVLKSINGESTFIKGQAKWVIPRSSRNRSHRSGQPYCSGCLNEAPYLSNEWRLAWYFGCLKHEALLETKCLCCGELYQPHLLSAEKRQLNYCHHCGTKLDVVLTLLSNTEIKLLAMLNNVFTKNSGYCFGKKVNAHVYFDILRYFINLVRRAAVAMPTHALARLVKQFGVLQSEICQTRTALAFELLPVEERKNYVINAMKILQLSYEDFIYSMKQSGITQKFFAFENYPIELETLFKQALEGKTVSRKAGTNKSKGSSVLSLNRQWERLKRQLQITQHEHN